MFLLNAHVALRPTTTRLVLRPTPMNSHIVLVPTTTSIHIVLRLTTTSNHVALRPIMMINALKKNLTSRRNMKGRRRRNRLVVVGLRRTR